MEESGFSGLVSDDNPGGGAGTYGGGETDPLRSSGGLTGLGGRAGLDFPDPDKSSGELSRECMTTGATLLIGLRLPEIPDLGTLFPLLLSLE